MSLIFKKLLCLFTLSVLFSGFFVACGSEEAPYREAYVGLLAGGQTQEFQSSQLANQGLSPVFFKNLRNLYRNLKSFGESRIQVNDLDSLERMEAKIQAMIRNNDWLANEFDQSNFAMIVFVRGREGAEEPEEIAIAESELFELMGDFLTVTTQFFPIARDYENGILTRAEAEQQFNAIKSEIATYEKRIERLGNRLLDLLENS